MKKLTFLLLIVGLSAFHTLAQSQDRELPIPEKNAISTCDATSQANPEIINASFPEQFQSFWSGLTDTSQWPPRWNCGTWTPFHGWLYLSSDLAIWLAYFMIPLVMAFFIFKKKNSIPYRSVYMLFIAFILACGLTHLIDAIIFWWPAYRLSAVIRFITAAVSWASVIALVKVVPDALTLPSHKELFNEIKHRKIAEEQLETKLIELESINQELESFSYSVSHDLRAPLRTIHGFTKALVEDYEKDLNDEAKDYLKRVSNASIRMGQLIDDLLDLSRISRKNFVASHIDLTALAHEVVSDIKTSTYTKAEFTIEKGMVTIGDIGLMRVVLENLISNSVKYSHKKGPSKIKIGKIEDSEHGTVFFVQDNGVGFNTEYADKIFGAFQRLHDSSFEGTGIGLATVLRIINRHQGKIWAESEVGKGSTFYFNLNVKLSGDGQSLIKEQSYG